MAKFLKKTKNIHVSVMHDFENLSVYFTDVLRSIIACFIKYNQY